MARYGVELLVMLAGSLLMVSAQKWEWINEEELHSMYQTRDFNRQQSTVAPGIINESDSDELLEEDYSEVDGGATTEDLGRFTGLEHQVNQGESGPNSWIGGSDGGYHVEFVDSPEPNWSSSPDDEDEIEFVEAHPRGWIGSSTPSPGGMDVVCSDNGFQITLLTGSLRDVKVLGSKDLLSVTKAPESCGYDVNLFSNILSVPFTGCHVKNSDGYNLQLLFVDEFGQTKLTTASCEELPESEQGLSPRATGQSNPSKCSNPSTTKAQNCAVATGERVTCGQSGISSADCEKMGCCVDSSTSACFYPADECTGDQHFVFTIRHDSASIPVDPTKLVIPASPNCKPVIVNDKVAVFKFKVTECGTRSYMVGETKIYLAEVQSAVQALNLKYGIVTRSDPLRFMVECRYGKSGSPSNPLASIGFMVKTPSSSLPSEVTSNGLYGVELRISKDSAYSSYLPTYHQPLKLLLGKPVYLELRLKSPKPDAVIIVNYCIAYPRSAKNALVLVYEGCANPYDTNVSILKVSDLPKNRHQRRFVVKAFQFMDQKTNKYLDEEIYFMCSTEVCRTAEKTCEERCFDGKAP